MLAAANRPSEMRVGSQSSHCSLGIATVVLPDSRKTLRFKNEPRELLKWQPCLCEMDFIRAFVFCPSSKSDSDSVFGQIFYSSQHWNSSPHHQNKFYLRQNTRQFWARWWPRRASWWWSPPRSTCRWCTPSAPRPTAAWSLTRWGRWPRPGYNSPPDWAGSPFIGKYSLKIFVAQNVLPFGSAAPGPVPPYHVLDTLRGQDQQNWKREIEFFTNWNGRGQSWRESKSRKNLIMSFYRQRVRNDNVIFWTTDKSLRGRGNCWLCTKLTLQHSDSI